MNPNSVPIDQIKGFRPRPGSKAPGWNKKSANIIGQQILDFRNKHSRGITADDLVKYGTPVNSPSHHLYEWDDKKCGVEFRLIQARFYLRSIEVITLDIHKVVHTRRFMLHLKEHNYVTIDDVLLDPEKRELALKDALSELQAFTNKYEEFTEIIKFIDVKSLKRALDRYTKKVEKIIAKAKKRKKI